MQTLKEIAEEIYRVENTKSYKDLVLNIEKNLSLIETFNLNESEENYDTYSQLIADYGIALAEIESYKKAIPIIDMALGLYINNPNIPNEKLKELIFYEKLLFNRGKSYYNLENYDKAKPDFELLIALYPNNDVYPKWTKAIQNKFLYLVQKYWWYFILAVLIGVNLLPKEGLYRFVVSCVGGIAIIIGLLIELKLYLNKKKPVDNNR
jgi:tetratricopeptide (TPR) repeat protein